MSNLKARNFQFEQQTRAARLNAALYVFTPLRDLDLRKLNICFPRMNRCEMYLIETYPVYRPDPAALVESGQLIIQERMVPAQLQILTLQESFKREGLVAIDCDLETAQEIEAILQEVKGMSLPRAISHIRTKYAGEQFTPILVEAFTEALRHATGVLNVTRREIQNARSGKAGKAFIDERDSLFCTLTETPELSLLAPEGQAAHNNVTNLVNQLSSALGGGVNRGSSDVTAQLIETIETLQNQVNELQEKVLNPDGAPVINSI